MKPQKHAGRYMAARLGDETRELVGVEFLSTHWQSQSAIGG
jgi:hypothetical protein